jgi:hypothetical protein
MRKIQARHEDVVKFIESEGKLLEEKAVVDPGQVTFYALKEQRVGKIWAVFAE